MNSGIFFETCTSNWFSSSFSLFFWNFFDPSSFSSTAPAGFVLIKRYSMHHLKTYSWELPFRLCHVGLFAFLPLSYSSYSVVSPASFDCVEWCRFSSVCILVLLKYLLLFIPFMWKSCKTISMFQLSLGRPGLALSLSLSLSVKCWFYFLFHLLYSRYWYREGKQISLHIWAPSYLIWFDWSPFLLFTLSYPVCVAFPSNCPWPIAITSV